MTNSFDMGDEHLPDPDPVPSGAWDEGRWEDFLRRHEKRLERFLQDVQSFLSHQLAPGRTDDLPTDREEALVAYLQKRGWRDPETFVAWLAAEDAPANLPDLLVEDAAALAARLSAWGELLPDALHDSSLVTLLVAAYDGASMLARAARFGQERDAIGGAIACTKRALGHAHTATAAMAEVRRDLGLGGAGQEVRSLAAALHEHRNAVALRILELRERAALGVD